MNTKVDYGLNEFDKNNPIPSMFDARIRWPNCKSIGDVKNQGACKSGWVTKLKLNILLYT